MIPNFSEFGPNLVKNQDLRFSPLKSGVFLKKSKKSIVGTRRADFFLSDCIGGEKMHVCRKMSGHFSRRSRGVFFLFLFFFHEGPMGAKKNRRFFRYFFLHPANSGPKSAPKK